MITAKNHHPVTDILNTKQEFAILQRRYCQNFILIFYFASKYNIEHVFNKK